MPTGAARLGYWFIDTSPPLPPTILDQFVNPGFELGTTGYTITLEVISWGGSSILAGFPTPALPSPNLYGSPGPATSITLYPINSYVLDTVDKPPLGEVQSMRLNQGSGRVGIVYPAGASLWGPAIYTNYYVTFNAGETCAFDWRAISGQDAYSIYAYLVEKDTGNVISLLRTASPDASFDSVWTTNATVVPTTGNYKFVFVCGSWDSTYGNYTAGSLLIDNLRRIP